MAIVLDGKSLALKIRQELKQKVEEQAVKPGLVVLLVGEDSASQFMYEIKNVLQMKWAFIRLLKDYLRLLLKKSY